MSGHKQHSDQDKRTARHHVDSQPDAKQITTPQVDSNALRRATAQPTQAPPDDILALQRTYGNQAVTHLISRSPGHTPDVQRVRWGKKKKKYEELEEEPEDDGGYGERLAAFQAEAGAFLKNAYVVTREELGEKSLRQLAEETEDEQSTQRTAPAHINDSTPLLSAVDAREETEEDKEAEESKPKAMDRLSRIVQQVRAWIGGGDDDVTKMKLLTLKVAEKELRKLLDTHGNWKRVLLTFGVGGPAAYLEEHVLSYIVGHMDLHVKEMVPWSTGRKNKTTATNIGEGALDVAWNTTTLAAESVFSPLTNFGTAGIGAAYKGGIAGSKSKMSGAGKSKASLVAAATATLEFLQGLIPYYGSVMGITGGTKNIVESLNPKKRYEQSVRGYAKSGKVGQGDRRIIPLLEGQLERCVELVERGQKLGSQAKPLVKELIKTQKYLREQLQKSEGRFGEREDKGKTSLL